MRCPHRCGRIFFRQWSATPMHTNAHAHGHARGPLRALVRRVVSYSKSTSLTSKGDPAHSKSSPVPARQLYEMPQTHRPASISRYRADNSSSLIRSNTSASAAASRSLCSKVRASSSSSRRHSSPSQSSGSRGGGPHKSPDRTSSTQLSGIAVMMNSPFALFDHGRCRTEAVLVVVTYKRGNDTTRTVTKEPLVTPGNDWRSQRISNLLGDVTDRHSAVRVKPTAVALPGKGRGRDERASHCSCRRLCGRAPTSLRC